MARPAARIAVLHASLLVGSLGLLIRAAHLQLVRGEELARRAERQRTVRVAIPAHRGTLFDRRGSPLALSLERYRVGIAPREVSSEAWDSVVRLARVDLGLTARERRGLARAGGRYFYAHGPFTAGQVERIRRFRGVHLEPVFRREYPSGHLARPLIGGLAADSAVGASGLERFLDSLLAGTPGEAVLLRDATGRTYESPGRLLREPVAGHHVVLTIDRELQEIAEAALAEAFDELSPRRGDVVFLDPRTGEVLAAASRESGAAGGDFATASFFVTAFEPGSTAKPFTAAALLELARVSPADAVSAEGGTFELPVPGGRPRTIRDDHPESGPITLARAVQVSSNVAMVKFSQRLTAEEHFDMLRAFGFGTPTGIEFGAEAAGSLARPDRWRPGQHGASAAMGYAFEVTPIQLAAAYGAIANDGILLAPSLIREIRDPDGGVRYRHRPLGVRRVVSSETAAELRRFLALAATDSGTGSRAQVRGGVLGKTGTAKLVRNRVYTAHYAASFAGIFPARDPQLVVVVRIEDPRGGEYYGGRVAAPITARMLRQALAARRTAIDRTRLADEAVAAPPAAEPEGTRPEPTVVVSWPVSESKATATITAEIPDVAGRNLRAAALALHRRGFRVRVEGTGAVIRTVPAVGSMLALGRTVTLVAGGRP